MKAIMLKGVSNTGKTTTAEAIIRELKRRGYTVGSVKDIHFEAFTMETPGSDTDRHRKAGAQPVTARGRSETNIVFDRALDIEDILDCYDQDYVVLEGDSGANCPVIITGATVEELDEIVSDRTIAVSGVIAGRLDRYRDIPVFDGLTQIQELVDLIEAKTPEWKPPQEGRAD